MTKPVGDTRPLGSATAATVGGMTIVSMTVFTPFAVEVEAQELPAAALGDMAALLLFVQGLLCLGVVVTALLVYRIPWLEVGVTPPRATLWHLVWIVLVFGTLFNLFPFDNTLARQCMGFCQFGYNPAQAYYPTSFKIWFMVLGFGLVVPLAQSLIFFGLLIRYFHLKWGHGMAIFLSALLFALPYFVVTSFLYMLVLGVFLGLLRRYLASVWAPMLFLMYHNLNWGLLALGLFQL